MPKTRQTFKRVELVALVARCGAKEDWYKKQRDEAWELPTATPAEYYNGMCHGWRDARNMLNQLLDSKSST